MEANSLDFHILLFGDQLIKSEYSSSISIILRLMILVKKSHTFTTVSLQELVSRGWPFRTKKIFICGVSRE